MLANILQNAFKFTLAHTEVRWWRAQGDRVLIEVADHCGGLPSGAVQRNFEPFAQAGQDRNGLGLGLAISKKSVEASGGMLTVRDGPSIGCVFTIDLPRQNLVWCRVTRHWV